MTVGEYILENRRNGYNFLYLYFLTFFILHICIPSNRSPYVLNLSLFSQRVCTVSNTKLLEYYYYKNNN